MSRPECPICAAGRPRDVITDLEGTWVTLPPFTPLPGYVCLVAKRHVREPFELPDSERRAFWDDVDCVASALHASLRPEKPSYEIHGNTIPHLHLHLFPRWSGDRFDGRPIDGRDAIQRTNDDRAAVLEALRHLAPSN